MRSQALAACLSRRLRRQFVQSPNSPEVPFWPQLPRLSERESIVGQGLGIVENLIEPRNEGYGYQVKEGQLNSVLEIFHRSSGELTPANAAGFGAFEEA